MRVLAIDPGEKESALVEWDGSTVLSHRIAPNGAILDYLENPDCPDDIPLVIEWIEGYGLTVGQSVFETCRWVGEFGHAWKCWGRPVHLLSRRKVKQHLCNNVSAKDSHVGEALRHRIGEKGTKKNPGPLFGIVSHEYAALAVAVTWMDQNGD
jgi:hypothetical protein